MQLRKGKVLGNGAGEPSGDARNGKGAGEPNSVINDGVKGKLSVEDGDVSFILREKDYIFIFSLLLWIVGHCLIAGKCWKINPMMVVVKAIMAISMALDFTQIITSACVMMGYA